MHCSCPMNSARGADKKRKKEARRKHMNPKRKPNGHLACIWMWIKIINYFTI